MRTFAKIADTVGKKMCESYVLSLVNMFYFREQEFSSELREDSLNSRTLL